MKDTLYDRNDIKLTERIEELRKKYPSLKVTNVKIKQFHDEVSSCDIEYDDFRETSIN